MYLSSIKQGYFLVRNGFQNDVDFLHDAIELCAQNTNIVVSSMFTTVGKTYVINQREREGSG
jgi:hypothetical protein